MLWSASSAKVLAITPLRGISCKVPCSYVRRDKREGDFIPTARSADKRPSSRLQVQKDNKHRHSRGDLSRLEGKRSFRALRARPARRFELSLRFARQPKCRLAQMRDVIFSNFSCEMRAFRARLLISPHSTYMRNIETAEPYHAISGLCMSRGHNFWRIAEQFSCLNVTFTSWSFKGKVNGEENSLRNLSACAA